MEEAADEEAIRSVLSGDREAFRILVERYQGRLVGFCRSRLGSATEAEDAAQEILIKTFSSLRSYRLGESFPSWLFAIAANHLRTRGKRNQVELRRVESAGIEEAARPPVPDAGEEVLLSLEAEELRSAVAALPEELGLPVQLHYFGGLSVEDIGRSLGLGREAVKARLFRARKRLRKALENAQPPGREGSNHP